MKSKIAESPLKKRSIWQQIKASRDSYLLMAPFMILFFIFTVLPVLMSIFLSFTYFDMLKFPKFIAWDNFKRLFLDDDIFLIVVKNTLVYAIITGPISYILSFLFAWLINEFKPRTRALLTLVFYAPALAGASIYVIWQFIFSGDQYGLINGLLLQVGFIKEPIAWLTNQDYMLGVIIVIQLWLSLGQAFLSFIAGLQTIDKELYEAIAIDGVKNRFQELWYVTLPSMAPQLLFGAVMQIGASFGISVVIMKVAGFPTSGYQADSIVTYITDQGIVRFEMGYASAIAVLLFGMMLLTNFIITNALRKFSDS